MTLYGVDIHPQYQAGISIEQIAAEGFDFLAVKVSEGTATYGGQDWLRRGKACGLLCLAYHYLRPGNETGQAQVFAGQLKLAGVPGMLDVEAVTNGGEPTLGIGNVLAFLAECRNQRVNVPLVYLPRWYWERMGSPNLTGLPRLWGSSYVSAGPGYASDIYSKVTFTRWASYGGPPVSVLQFTDQAKVAGKLVDANAFNGTRDDFAKMIGVSDMTDEEHKLLQDCRDQLYRRIPTRAGNPQEDPKNPYTDDTLGYAANADGYGWRIERKVDALAAAVDALTKLVTPATKPPAGSTTAAASGHE